MPRRHSTSGPQDDAALWEMYEDSDCPSLENAAVAETEDLNVCKKAVAKGQLKGKGIGCFVQRGGKTVFKQCTTEQAMSSKTTARGAKLFIMQDPASTKHTRMMQAVEGEGLPRLRAPFENGNLFINFTVEFPDSIPATAAKEILAMLGPPKHIVSTSEVSLSARARRLRPPPRGRSAARYPRSATRHADRPLSLASAGCRERRCVRADEA